jgi:hypothetical protein
MTNRRGFLINSMLAITGAGMATWLGNPLIGTVDAKSPEDKDSVTVIAFDDAGQKLGASRVQKVRKTDAEWKQQLTPQQFEVTRRMGTERAFTGEYAESKDKGSLSLHLLQQCTLQFRNQV